MTFGGMDTVWGMVDTLEGAGSMEHAGKPPGDEDIHMVGGGTEAAEVLLQASGQWPRCWQ